jgi:hypothetical protein
MPGPPSVCSVGFFVDGDALAECSPMKDRKLVLGAEPPVEDIVLSLGGCELVKDSSRLDNELGLSIKVCIVSCLRKDLHHGQPKEMTYYCG